MVSGRNTKYQYKWILDLLILFTIKNVASGYTLCHLENRFFHLHVCFKIVARKSEVSPYKLKYRKKNTTLNTKDLKSGTKRIIMKMI